MPLTGTHSCFARIYTSVRSLFVLSYPLHNMQALQESPTSLVLVADEGITVQRPWQTFLESCVDTTLRLQPLPAAQGREPNMEVSVLRSNRWGGAAGLGSSSRAESLEVEQSLYATVTERGTTFQYCN